MPNYRYSLLRDGAAKAAMWNATDLSRNAFWNAAAKRDYTCNVLFSGRPGFEKYSANNSCTCAPGSPGQTGAYGGVVDFDPCSGLGEHVAGRWAELPRIRCHAEAGAGGFLQSSAALSDDAALPNATLLDCMKRCKETPSCTGVVRNTSLKAREKAACSLLTCSFPLPSPSCIADVALDKCEYTGDLPEHQQFSTWLLKWVRHEATNCFIGNGGSMVPGRPEYFPNATLAECKAACEAAAPCNAIVVDRGLGSVHNSSSPGRCWLRTAVARPTATCKSDSGYDTWLLN
mmetsp:Transcript_41705/g.108004  ORF Transcript_41705/g.108004 Transcript_41705/m.108004 type:complete len:288 (+) Transcript_41705:1108-1971(+)